MAEIMKHELWERGYPRFLVYKLPDEAETQRYYPSPNELKRCILLKNKGNLSDVMTRMEEFDEPPPFRPQRTLATSERPEEEDVESRPRTSVEMTL
jgi:hypothetical protein